jgi:hypothetical protein
LERLGLSSIDLYMTHAPDDKTPIAETFEALAAFIDQGLVRSIGACKITDEQLRVALDRQVDTEPDNTSEVEVRFVAETPRRTRVELEHRKIDRHGTGWQAVAEGVKGDAAWVVPQYHGRWRERSRLEDRGNRFASRLGRQGRSGYEGDRRPDRLGHHGCRDHSLVIRGNAPPDGAECAVREASR